MEEKSVTITFPIEASVSLRGTEFSVVLSRRDGDYRWTLQRGVFRRQRFPLSWWEKRCLALWLIWRRATPLIKFVQLEIYRLEAWFLSQPRPLREVVNLSDYCHEVEIRPVGQRWILFILRKKVGKKEGRTLRLKWPLKKRHLYAIAIWLCWYSVSWALRQEVRRAAYENGLVY